MPVFDDKGNMIKIAVGDIQKLYEEWRDLVREGFPLQDILKLVTSNPAKRAGIFQGKGSIEQGKEADLLVLDNDLKIETVMAKGQVMVDQGRVLVKGTFEE
jgi:beta-aspartyl-dipeptidase (metallo-type)